MRLLHARTQALRVAPSARARLQFVVRTLSPAGDRAFSHVVREGAAGSRIRAWGQVFLSGRARRAHTDDMAPGDGLGSPSQGARRHRGISTPPELGMKPA